MDSAQSDWADQPTAFCILSALRRMGCKRQSASNPQLTEPSKATPAKAQRNKKFGKTMTKNYYTILGIPSHASQEEIRQAYEKALAKVRSYQSREAIVEVEEAYFVLSDPDARFHYDNIYRISAGLLSNFDGLDASKMVKNADNLNTEIGDFDEPEFLDDLLETVQDIFSGMTGLPKSKEAKRSFEKQFSAKSNIYLDLKISSQEAFSGGYKNIEYQAYIKCSGCGGLGSQNAAELVSCAVCAGGVKSFSGKNNCSVCAGLGKYPEVNCPKCKGQGRVMAIKKAEVLVPPKVRNGTILKVAKQGHCGFRNLPNGDLILRVAVKTQNER